MTKQVTIDSVLVRDFSKLGLLSSFLGLSSEMQITSTACDCIEFPPEVVTYDSPFMGKLYVATLTNDELFEALALGAAFDGLSFGDYTVLYMAHRDGTILITGDSRVSKVAAAMNITVYDYLWVFCEMVKAGQLALEEAIFKYYELAKSVNKLAIWEEPAIALREAYSDYKQIA
jgi:hypothetical protein